MKYCVMIFHREGIVLKKAFADRKSFREAFEFVAKNCYTSWGSAIVINRKGMARAYDDGHKSIKSPRFFKSDSTRILVLFGTHAQFYNYESTQKRDEVFACLTSTPAASVASDKEQTDTTVYSAETGDSKSGLTSKKISNGSAIHATWTGALIHWNTATFSGKDSAKSTAKDTWSDGSKDFRSLPDQILVTVKTLPRPERSGYPGTNESMLLMQGKQYVAKKVTLDKELYMLFDGTYSWYFLPEWLDFEPKKIEPEPVKKWGILVGGPGLRIGITIAALKKHIGTHMEFEKSKGSGNWMMQVAGGYWVPESWIQFDAEEK